MKKIVITGPESTGKTTLSNQLAAFFGVPMVTEYARAYLQQLEASYVQKDIEIIGKGQLAEEDRVLDQGGTPFFICDTSLIVLKIWSEYKYGGCSPWLLRQLEERDYHLFLLCRPDIPWAYDPLRENPLDRDQLYVLYKEALEKYGFDYVEIGGEGRERFNKAVHRIKEFIGNS